MNIAIIGAGTGGTNLIESFSKLKDINIVLIVDPNIHAPGIAKAKELGIACSQSIKDISNYSIDTIIEVTGKDKVIKELHQNFAHTHNIIDSHAALLLMTLVERDTQTLEILNNQLNVINSTTDQVQNQLFEITKTIESMQNVSDKLSISTQTSILHLKESDKIIQYVNNIAKQIKILGINATIEAARAGEYGRGFTVVANEIQVLANNSARYASEINEILLHVSKEMRSIDEEAKRIDALAKTQVDASDHVNKAMARLVKEVHR